MKLKLALLMLSASVLMSLAACANSGENNLTANSVMPAIPQDIKTCINKVVPVPLKDIRTKKQIVAIIRALKRSEMAKTYCGRRLIALYEANRNYLEGN